ncbi:MAG: Crp/Fnr family transcriptional regulator [Candidatus Binataceae bacterium]
MGVSLAVPSNGFSQHRFQDQLKTEVPAHLVDELISHHTRICYPKDAIVFLQGAPADVTFCILSGLVKLYCPSGDGNRILLRLAGPGDFLGHIDSVDPEGRRAQLLEAQAFSRCSLALVTREHIRKLADTIDNHTLVRLMELLNTAWSSVVHQYAVFLGLSFRERLEAVLRDLGTRFGAKEKRGLLLLPELSHMDFAEMIQSSRPMVSRLIAQMIEEGLMERRGRQYILTDRLVSNSANDDAAALSNVGSGSLGMGVVSPASLFAAGAMGKRSHNGLG